MKSSEVAYLHGGLSKAQRDGLVARFQDPTASGPSLFVLSLKAGGTEPKPAQDMGFMYNRTFHDPDGNVFEPMWMDPGAVQG